MLILEDKFWSVFHSNMFTFYVSLTKGQKTSFKRFSSGGDITAVISKRFLSDPLKCLCLYRCLYEVQDYDTCNTNAKAEIFKHDDIILNGIRLSPSDLECVALFIISTFRKQWSKINLDSCYIQNHGMYIMHHVLNDRGVTITKLCLEGNGLTEYSFSFISDIVINYKVKELWIGDNDSIGENNQFYSMLNQPSSRLEILSLRYTWFSSTAAINLFTILQENNTLKILSVSNNNITNTACDAIISAMRVNSSLIRLTMVGNPIDGKLLIKIVDEALIVNNTLEVLWLSPYSHDVQKQIRSAVEDVNLKRESGGCHVELCVYFGGSSVTTCL